MSTPANPPAFARPTSKGQNYCDDESQEGMSLRDYFAAKAMVGILSAPKNIGSKAALAESDIAYMAYAAADAMLAERAKTL